MYELVPGLFKLRRTLGSNIYLVPDNGHIAIIDAGFPLDERRILRALGGNPVSLIVATHCHIDHVGTACALRERYDCRIAAHKDDAPVIEGEVPFRRYRLGALRFLFYNALGPLYRYRTTEVDLHLEEGDVIDILGGLRVISLPGHSEGSIALFQEERGILFSGDSIRNENRVLEGPPPQFSVDADMTYRAIEEKILPLDFDLLFPGHGEPILSGAHRQVASIVNEWQRVARRNSA